MSDSKRTPEQHSLGCDVETPFPSPNVTEGNSHPRLSHSVHSPITSAQPSFGQAIQTLSTSISGSDNTSSMNIQMMPTHSTVATGHRVPYPLSDLQSTIPLTTLSVPQQQSHFPIQEFGYQTPAVQDYPHRQPSPYHPHGFHEIRPPEREVSHIRSPVSFSPRDLSSVSAEVPITATSSISSVDYSRVAEGTVSLSTRQPRTRGRRGRKAATEQIQYRRSSRQLEARPYQPRSRRARGRSRGSLTRLPSPATLVETQAASGFGPDSSSIEAGSSAFHFDKEKVYAEIIEQPQSKALRFRYICEGRSAGSIPGIRSTPESKTYPTIKVMNYTGLALVVVSCVTVDPPYRPHPHNLVGKEGCEGGVCSVMIENESMEYSFSNLGIQCVKKRDVEKSLTKREEKGIDPYCTGFSHRDQPQNIDLNAVKLCFQVYLKNEKTGQLFPLKPVLSDPIYDKKATSDLVISKLSDCSSSASGGREIILLCDKVTKEDVQVRFFELEEGHVVWEAFGDFQASDVHKQVAISFKTPQYINRDIRNPVRVHIQLYRPSDKSTSEPRPFIYYPVDTEQRYTREKLERTETEPKELIEILLASKAFQQGRGKVVDPSTGAISKARPSTSSSHMEELQLPLSDEPYSFHSPSTEQKRSKLRHPLASSSPKAGGHPSQEILYHPTTLYQPSASSSHKVLTSKPGTSGQLFPSPFATSELSGPTASYSGTASLSQAASSEFKAEDLLDLDSQHLVHSVDPLPDLGLFYTRDLCSSDITMPHVAVCESGSSHGGLLMPTTTTHELFPFESQSGKRETPKMMEQSLAVPLASRPESPDRDDSNHSSNSESVKKLKMDLETLRKLSR